MDRLAIEFICAFGMPPVEFVRLAARLGVSRIGLAPAPITDNPHGYEPWDLRGNPSLLRETKSALKDHGVKVSQGEGFLIMPGTEIADSEAILDIMAELGAPVVNCVVVEQNRSRALDQFARLADMASERQLIATLEFMPMMSPGNLGEALAFVVESGAANGKLMIDAMHLYRSGATSADLAAIDPAIIGYAQLCDVPMPAQIADYGEEARHERRSPGDGDLPLEDFLRALPRDITVGLEVPMMSKAQAGILPEQALKPCVDAARKLLSELD
ncbi:MAG: sugar phosphate isomerase/epimerase [Novosphingobium sp.]|nr:sugar phosphate isomerase/epimerase [Novosphingobium sp.]